VPLTKGQQMARVRSRDTKPELLLRRMLTVRGVRYRLHRKDLPGTPDIYVPRLRLAIFVHGCFWHGHDCVKARRPATNVGFWNVKLDRNMMRDAAAIQALADHGIASRVVWTCQTSAAFEATSEQVRTLYEHADGHRRPVLSREASSRIRATVRRDAKQGASIIRSVSTQMADSES